MAESGPTQRTDCFRNLKPAPFDPILGLMAMCGQDPSPDKVNLSVGAYRTLSGDPYVLKVIRKAEKMVFDDQPYHEYLPNDGFAPYVQGCREFLLGADHVAIKENRMATVQTPSGSCALRVSADFIRRHLPKQTLMLMSDPPWGNHLAVFEGIKTELYPYLNKENQSLDFEGMCTSIRHAPSQSVILLHACAHNPTGIDLSESQWRTVMEICKERDHIPYVDIAYQGFASGDPDKDAYAVRLFAENGFSMFVAQSFSKNLGLYGERIGAFHCICPTKECAAVTLSNMKLIVRANYATPPLYAARLVHKVLSDPQLVVEWRAELKMMAGQVTKMRQLLFDAITANGTPGDWSYILSHVGMFSYTAVTGERTKRLIRDFHIYMGENGRLSMCGITPRNVKYVAKAIHCVMTDSPTPPDLHVEPAE